MSHAVVLYLLQDSTMPMSSISIRTFFLHKNGQRMWLWVQNLPITSIRMGKVMGIKPTKCMWNSPITKIKNKLSNLLLTFVTCEKKKKKKKERKRETMPIRVLYTCSLYSYAFVPHVFSFCLIPPPPFLNCTRWTEINLKV